MNELIRGMRAERLKMRHTFLYLFHAALPILASTLFLLYYQFAGQQEQTQISIYMQIIGIALPLVISIVCAGNVALEEENHFQVLLGSSVHKWKGFFIKWVVLTGLGILSITGAVFLFGTGYHFGLGKNGLSASRYLQLLSVLLFGSVPLYLEHLFFNLKFSKTVSNCIGVAEFLLSALFLTGLGDGRWQFFPCTWSARGVSLLLEGEKNVQFLELRNALVICPLILSAMCVIIGIWFHFFEGRQYHD